MTKPTKNDRPSIPLAPVGPWDLAGFGKDDSGVVEVTVAELVAELSELAPDVTACVMDDQGVPHEIAWIRYRADLNMVAIESGCMVGDK